MAKSQRMSISLGAELYAALAKEAEKVDRSLADVARDKLRESLLGIGRQETIGEMAERLIRQGLSNGEVLTAIQTERPDAKTTDASIRWYRSSLRKQGEEIPNNIDARK